MIQEIYKKIWALSEHVQNPESYVELTNLTSQLIELYDSQGRINKDPFSSARERTVSLPHDKIQEQLMDSTCVVTGGLGCVGSILVNELLKFDVKAIIIIDNSNAEQLTHSEKIINVTCDIRNLENVNEIFAQYHPQFIFHTAAQHDPGYAESHIAETLTTNVLGTLNIVKACEASNTVTQMVFSSTGKASRYFTEEVYASTKKMCEFILHTYAKDSKVKYSMVRFTHILDNSLMNIELHEASKNDSYIALHSPGKYVTAQNAKEAACLMLNAILNSEDKQCTLLLTKYLEWPVESLEMALYHIKQSGRSIPVIFIGNPLGYSEKFFRGQMDWSRPSELNLLTNVYERKYRRLNEGEDIIITRACSTNKDILENVLGSIAIANGEAESKEALVEGLKKLVREALKIVNKEDTVDILHWGLEPKFLEMENYGIADFDLIIRLLAESLAGTEYYKEVEDLVCQNV